MDTPLYVGGMTFAARLTPITGATFSMSPCMPGKGLRSWRSVTKFGTAPVVEPVKRDNVRPTTIVQQGVEQIWARPAQAHMYFGLRGREAAHVQKGGFKATREPGEDACACDPCRCARSSTSRHARSIHHVTPSPHRSDVPRAIACVASAGPCESRRGKPVVPVAQARNPGLRFGI